MNVNPKASMKKLFLLAFLILMALILINRQRVYVRDPLAKVYRGTQKQDGVQVYINYSNDILLIKEGDSGPFRTLVQSWNKMPGTPKELRCIHWMACLADADHASLIPSDGAGKGDYDPRVVMSNRQVSFINPDGTPTRVDLR